MTPEQKFIEFCYFIKIITIRFLKSKILKIILLVLAIDFIIWNFTGKSLYRKLRKIIFDF